MPVLLRPILPPQVLSSVLAFLSAESDAATRSRLDHIPRLFGHQNPPSQVAAAGWTDHIHPGGLHYYQHEDKPIVTSLDPTVNDNHARIMASYIDIRNQLPQVWQEQDFHVVFTRTANEGVFGYYIVDYVRQQLFWANGGNGLQLNLNVWFGSALRTRFWTHVYHFPASAAAHVDLDTEIIKFRAELAVGRGLDDLPWSQEDCTEIDQLLKICSVAPPVYKATVLGRLKGILSAHRHFQPLQQRRRQVGLGHNVAVVPAVHANIGLVNDSPWPSLLDLVIEAGLALHLHRWTKKTFVFSVASVYLCVQALRSIQAGSHDPFSFFVSFSIPLATLQSSPVLGELLNLDDHAVRNRYHDRVVEWCLVVGASFSLASYGVLLCDCLNVLKNVESVGPSYNGDAFAVILLPLLVFMAMVLRD